MVPVQNHRGRGLIWLIGFMGSGKTTVGRLLSGRLGVSFVDTDQEIERLSGQMVSELFEREGEESFRRRELELVEQLSEHSLEKRVVACGGGLPCYHNLIDVLLASGTVIYLEARPETLVTRLVSEQQQRPLIRDAAAEELPLIIGRHLAGRRAVYERAEAVVHVDGKTPEAIVEEIAVIL